MIRRRLQQLFVAKSSYVDKMTNPNGPITDRRIIDRYMRLECPEFAYTVHKLDPTTVYYCLFGYDGMQDKQVFVHVFAKSKSGQVLDIKGPRHDADVIKDFPDSDKKIEPIKNIAKFEQHYRGADVKAATPFAKIILATAKKPK
jgi:hypothetical protein